MTRFDKIIDEKNAAAEKAENKATVESDIEGLKQQQRRMRYMPAIEKYWQQFKLSLNRLTYNTDVTVQSKVLLVTLNRKTKVRWFENYNSIANEYCFDVNGNCYENSFVSNVNYVRYVKPVNDKSAEELIYDMLPWSMYDYWLKYKQRKMLDDWFIDKRTKMNTVLNEMINGNADEAVAKYFETLL